jgi:hypothetical protein
MDANQLQEPTLSEKAVLAREVAADSFRVALDDLETTCEECSCTVFTGQPQTQYRKAVQHGWDAAMEYVKERDGKQIELERSSESDRL